MNISKMIEAHSKRNPSWDAVISEDQLLSWEDFNSRINRLGNALRRLGVNKGDRVAMYLPNSPEYLISYFAIARIGAVAVPFNIMYKGPEIKYIINNSEASVLLLRQRGRRNVLGIMEQLPTLKYIIVTGEGEVNGALVFPAAITKLIPWKLQIVNRMTRNDYVYTPCWVSPKELC